MQYCNVAKSKHVDARVRVLPPNTYVVFTQPVFIFMLKKHASLHTSAAQAGGMRRNAQYILRCTRVTRTLVYETTWQMAKNHNGESQISIATLLMAALSHLKLQLLIVDHFLS